MTDRVPLGRFVAGRELGRGGMGRVVEAIDPELQRVVAVKVPVADAPDLAAARARFLNEARLTGRLEHPNIVPVHEVGSTPDGAPYYVMRRVEGRSLREVFDALAAGEEGTARTFGRHRLLSVFVQVCHAVAFAHDQGVIHRDLKPENVMLGDYGEVLVVDWGVARDDRAREPAPAAGGERTTCTAFGASVGTPGYMSPEQAWGDHARVAPASDVFALGAILYELLAGSPAFRAADPYDRVQEAVAGPPEDPRRRSPDREIPGELADLCLTALHPEPEGRPPTAAELARRVEESLAGSRRREQAREVVARAATRLGESAVARRRAALLASEAVALAREVKPWHALERQREVWDRQDRALAAQTAADRAETEAVEGLHSALELSPGLGDARAVLANLYRTRLEEAEASRDARSADRYEALLAAYDDGRHAAWSRGEGTLSLATDPEGASVDLFRYESRDRRWVAVPAGALGRTPLVDVPLGRGSWLLEIRASGCETVRYPVHLGRGDRWTGGLPSGAPGGPLRLPRAGELCRGDVYVPAGPFLAGGDPEALYPTPRSVRFLPSFVIRRFPVTNREFLVFLDDLVDRGYEDEALRHAPRERSSRPGELGALIVSRSTDGGFELAVDAEGDAWDPDWPVCMVDWHGAAAYARWEAERTGLPWRLPCELEREKAARGADGRFFPWGDACEPSFACVRENHEVRPQPAPVDSHPVDESPYGVRGLAGNMRDWCLDVHVAEGPADPAEPGVPAVEAATDAPRVYRGGSWSFVARSGRAADRSASLPTDRWANVGFRLARSVR